MSEDAREKAKRLGNKTYQGQPCDHGHTGERYTRDGNCKECQKEKLRRWRERKRQERFPNGYKPWKQCAEGNKVCTTCRTEKGHEEYGPDCRSSDGLQPSCRECNRQRQYERYWENPEDARQKHREYHARNPEVSRQISKRQRVYNAERLRERKRQEYLKNREDPEWREKQRRKRQQNKEAKRRYDRLYRLYVVDPEKAKQRAKEWTERNPEKRKAIVLNYAARRRSWTESGVSAKELAAWESEQKKDCYWCGAACAGEYHVDHYVPLSKGGEHELHNLVIACPTCNLRKNAKDPYEFAQSVGRLF